LERSAGLDGLRGFAAFFVVIAHITNQTKILELITGNDGGETGVMIFFTLSAFLMGRLYANQPINESSLISFYRHRFSRVAPIYISVVLLAYCAYRYFGDPVLYQIDNGNLAKHLMAVEGTSVLWTIPLEVHFYLWFPLSWLVIRSYGNLSWMILLSVVIVVDLFLPITNEDLLHLPFFIGGLIASRLSISQRYGNLAFVISVLMLLLIAPNIWLAIGLHRNDVLRFAMAAVIVGVLVLSASTSVLASRILGNRVMSYLGAISFSAYLLHWPIMRALTLNTSLAAHPLRYGATVIMLTIIVSSATFFFIERPARRILNGSMKLQFGNIWPSNHKQGDRLA